MLNDMAAGKPIGKPIGIPPPPTINQPQAAAAKFFGKSDMAYMNLEGTRRQAASATERKYAAQGGGGPGTSMLINESSGAGGGGGGGGYSGKREEEQEDRAEVVGFEEDSISSVNAKMQQLARGGQIEYAPITVQVLIEICGFMAQAYIPFSAPVFFN